MNNITISENKQKFYCETCNYGTDYNSAFVKHQKSERHIRKGKNKVFKCEKCSYETETSHWNLKMHILSKHSTIEERSKQKYYCAICDSIFFSPLFYKNHIKSILHINKTILNKISENNVDIVYNNNIDTVNNEQNIDRAELKAELKAEIKVELKKEIISEIKKKLLDLFT